MAKSTNSLEGVASRPINNPGRRMKGRLCDGEVLLGSIIVAYAQPSLVKLFQHAGFDFIFLEYEHGSFNPCDLANTVLCARDNGIPIIAKTPQLERAEVAKLLECGVVGIQLPRTESREEVETLQSYLKYPPQGSRAIAPGWGNSSYAPVPDYRPWMDEQDKDTMLVVHIETRKGYENAEEIISTPGVDIVYVGPGDFSVEMGHPGQSDHPGVIGPMEEIFQICRKHQVPFGTTTSGIEGAAHWIAQGAQFFEVIDEVSLILQGASQVVHDYRTLMQ